jgi:hypothetical protein
MVSLIKSDRRHCNGNNQGATCSNGGQRDSDRATTTPRKMGAPRTHCDAGAPDSRASTVVPPTVFRQRLCRQSPPTVVPTVVPPTVVRQRASTVVPPTVVPLTVVPPTSCPTVVPPTVVRNGCASDSRASHGSSTTLMPNLTVLEDEICNGWSVEVTYPPRMPNLLRPRRHGD